MRQRHRHRWFQLVYALGMISACGGAQPVARVEPQEGDPCALADRITGLADTVSIAVNQELNAHRAPVPTNRSERLVFRQLYETLVTIDCTGQVRSGLAESWSTGDDGRVWTFVIRTDARFWDGGRVTARDVRSSWLSHRTSSMGGSIRAVLVVTDRSIVVTFNTPHNTVPTMFAHPAFAVVKNNPNGGWPIGTGPYRAPDDSGGPERRGSDAMILRPAWSGEAAAPPTLSIVRVGERDVRDVLDRDIDIVVTPDPRVIEYASGNQRFQSIALPWDRTYVLLSSSVVGDTVLARELIDERVDLARRAVSAEAQGSTDWFGETGLRHCEPLVAPPPVGERGAAADSPSRRIVYQSGDQVAQSLAERIVAKLDLIWRQRDERGLTAAPLTSAEFADALEHGDELAYIVSVARRPLAPCHELQTFATAIPWLRGDVTAVTLSLIDTRPRLIVRAGTADVSIEWDGTVILSHESRRAARDRSERE